MAVKKSFKVTGMHCKSCEMLAKDSVESIAGLKVLKADFKSGAVDVEAGDAKLLPRAAKALEAEGYKVVN
ncbi:MAG: heavy-metal-associated domain-containing protein [Candidatus Micrarchaeia archaeon]